MIIGKRAREKILTTKIVMIGRTSTLINLNKNYISCINLLIIFYVCGVAVSAEEPHSFTGSVGRIWQLAGTVVRDGRRDRG